MSRWVLFGFFLLPFLYGKKERYLLFFQPIWCADSNGRNPTHPDSSYKSYLKKIWWTQANVSITFLRDIRLRYTEVNSKLTTDSKFNLAKEGSFPKADRLMKSVTSTIIRKYRNLKIKVIFCYFVKNFNSKSRGLIVFPSGRGRAFKNIIVSSTKVPQVLAHELGHNLSLSHTKEARLMRHIVPSEKSKHFLTKKEKSQAVRHGLDTGKLIRAK